MARVAPEKADFRPALPSLFLAGLQPEKMMKLTYAEQLRHPNWQRKRLDCLEAAGWKCESCAAADQQLHVHHKLYVKARMAWEYQYGDELEVVCDACHAERHAVEALLNRVLATDTARNTKREALGLIAGYLAASYDLDLDLLRELSEMDDRAFNFARMVDLGVIASVIDSCEAGVVAEILKTLFPPGEIRGPVLEGLIARWSRKKADG